MTSNSNKFLFNRVNEMLEIDFDTTTEEDTIDIKTIKKLEELWKSLDSRNFQKSFFQEISVEKKNNNFLVFKNMLYINEPTVTVKNNYLNPKIIKNILIVIKKYIDQIQKYNGLFLLKDKNEINFLYSWILLSIWSQYLLSGEVKFSYPIFVIIYCYMCIEYKEKNTNEKDNNKFLQYCYKRLCEKIKPYDDITNKLNLLMNLFESNYPREKYLFIYNRILYLLSIRMGKKKYGEEKFPYNNIEKGYSIFDTLLFIILIENPEKIDQSKQNFFSIFGMFIKIVFDITQIKIKKKEFLYLSVKNGFNLDCIIIRLLNIIKIMHNYLANSTFIEKNTKNNFIAISSNFLAYAVFENKKYVSSELLDYIKKISFITPEQFTYLINKVDLVTICGKDIISK